MFHETNPLFSARFGCNGRSRCYVRGVDALYIHLVETTVTTKHLAEGIAADYDAERRLAGIGILDAVKRLGAPGVFRQVVLEDVALATR